MWLMEELNLSYEIKTFKRAQNGMAPPELKRLHPLGKSPIVSIDVPNGRKPMVFAESGPILEYFLDHFGADSKLVPKRYVDDQEGQLGGETESWLRYRYYMHYAEGSLMSPIQVHLIMNAVKNAPVNFLLKPITGMIAGKVSSEFLTQELKTHFTFVEDQLATAPDGGPFLCGAQLTAADIQMSIPVIATMNLSIVSKDQYPKIRSYAETLQNMEAYKRAAQKVEELEGKPFVPI